MPSALLVADLPLTGPTAHEPKAVIVRTIDPADVTALAQADAALGSTASPALARALRLRA